MDSPLNVIIIGASSGIGRELALLFGARGYRVGIAARRRELLDELAGELRAVAKNSGGATGSIDPVVRVMDVSDPDAARDGLAAMIAELGGADVVVISAGTGHLNPNLDWPPEAETIAVNVAGFAALAGEAMKHFLASGRGHLVGISSIAALRGSAAAPAYNASKAFESNYLEGLRQKAAQLKLPITVTDIQPGLVDTAMAKGEGLFWVQPPAKAAAQIMTAIEAKRAHAYITRRWCLFAWLLKVLPDAIYHRF